MNYSLIAALAALTTATVSVIALWIQGRRWSIALQTDLLLKLTEKFYDPQMRQIRRLAAQKLMGGQTADFEDVYQLLDFFVLLGTLLDKKALSLDLTYILFEYWIVRYWHCVAPRIHDLRKDHSDPELFITLERLAGKMDEYRRSRGLVPVSDEESHRFLSAESKN